MKTNPWFRFMIAALAVWRLSHLLAAEDGPWDVIARIRRALVWISIPFAFFIADWMLDRFVVWLALSGAASLANKFTPEPVIFEPLDGKDH
jgi:hypothetical protein